MQLKVKKLAGHVETPFYRYPDDSGLDLSTIFHEMIPDDATAVIKTGIAVELPAGTEMQIRPRSSWSAAGLYCHFGTVDEGYRGEIKVVITNKSGDDVFLPVGTRIAQGVICPVRRPKIVVVENLSQSARGSNGFGHTGMGGGEIVENLASHEVGGAE